MPNDENQAPAGILATAPADPTGTHALRNPLVLVIIPHQNYRGKKTSTQKATNAVHRAETRAKQEAFSDDLTAIIADQNEAISQVAENHNKKAEYVAGLLRNKTTYRKARAASLHNAIIHFKGKEMNSGHTKYNLDDILEAINEDEELQNLSLEDQQVLLDKLEEHRETKQSGVRASNKPATLDATATMKKIEFELANLFACTGAQVFAFMTRGHIKDTVVPTWVTSDSSEDFLRDVLKLSAQEILAMYELWSVTKSKSSAKSTVQTMQKGCAEKIIQGLRLATGEPGLEMSYASYEETIQKRFRVILEGWLLAVKMVKPSAIGAVDDITSLFEALSEGSCKWRKMTSREYSELKERLKAAPAKPRASRSDKGSTRGPKKRSLNAKGEEGPRKRMKNSGSAARVARKLPPRADRDSSNDGDSDFEAFLD